MKAWCAALAGETSEWPQVRTRSFFGFTALYRKEAMFAVLPRTRGMETANSLAFRIDAPTAKVRVRLEHDPRTGWAEIKKARWFTFELSSDADLHDALDWLRQAHEAAGKNRQAS
ncbi:MAG: hypothetical protein ACLPHP_00630 [Candidatus Sulfotelmatobacter sp.]